VAAVPVAGGAGLSPSSLRDENASTICEIPTMFVFDREGKTVMVFYSAPEDLHLKAERLLNSLLK
jgi:hypothetical protein